MTQHTIDLILSFVAGVGLGWLICQPQIERLREAVEAWEFSTKYIHNKYLILKHKGEEHDTRRMDTT